MGRNTVKVPRLCRRQSGWYWISTPSVKALGFSPVALGRDTSAAVGRATELNAAVAAARSRSTPAPPPSGSVAELVALYQESDRWMVLADKTREGYAGYLREIAGDAAKPGKAAHIKVATITRVDMVRMYEALRRAYSVSAAAARMRVWRLLIGFAYDTGAIAENPAKSLRIKSTTPRRQTWTPEQVDILCAHCEKVGRPSISLAVRLMYDTAQRPGDILALQWQQWDGDAWHIRQSKTKARVAVSVMPRTADALMAIRQPIGPVIVSERTGLAYSIGNFSHQATSVRRSAGLPEDLQIRDLRRTALTEAGQGGATVHELRALSGHMNSGTLDTYVTPTTAAAGAANRKRRGTS